VGPASNDCAPRPDNNTITCADNNYQTNFTMSDCDPQAVNPSRETATTCTAVSPCAAGCLAHPRSPSLCRAPRPWHCIRRGHALTLLPPLRAVHPRLRVR
jgi:hypothetical protein